MNHEKAAKAYELIAEGFATLAIAVLEQPGRAASPSLRAPDPADDLPFEDDGMAAHVAARTGGEVIPDTALGRCPAHGTAWTVKAAGISKKTNKAYDAFWKCDAVGCNEKPIPAWRNSHPIREGVAA